LNKDFNNSLKSLEKEEIIQGMGQFALLMGKMNEFPKCGFM